MTWLIKLLGIDRVRKAVSRLAGAFDALATDVEAARLKMTGARPAALTGPEPANGRKRARDADLT